MNHDLDGRTVAILVADGFEQREMTEPRRALHHAGARTCLVALAPGQVKGWNHDRYDEVFPVDLVVDAASPEGFDALFLPGAVVDPDALRASPAAMEFVRGFFLARKPVAAICHGLQPVIQPDIVRDRTVTSFPAVKADLVNAGANWVDASVVIDHGLVTSRSPADMEEFNERMISEFACHPQVRPAVAAAGSE